MALNINSDDTVVLGPEATVYVGAVISGSNTPTALTVYDVTEGRYRERADTPDKTSTASYPFKRTASGGLMQFECDVTAQVASAVSPHVIPLYGVRAGSAIGLQLFPRGVNNDAGYFYDVPALVLADWEGDLRVQGSAPQTIKFSGKSDGEYILAGMN